MPNLYQHGTLLSIENCTILDITSGPIRNKNWSMKNFLREIRTQRGLTQEKLAELVGTSHPTVQRHENSKRRLTHEWIAKYSQALQCHPSDITEGPGTMMAAGTEQEKNLLKLLRMMNDEDQSKFIHMAEIFVGDNFPKKAIKNDSKGRK